MADIFELLGQFLCYSNQSCMQEFNQYAYKPMEGIFYLVFFPIVFIVVFIYLLSSKLFPMHRGLRVLISVAFIAMIILQGWYGLFMMIGKMWIIDLIILGFFWIILFGLRGGPKGGGGKGRMFDESDGGGKIINFLQESTGRVLNPVEAKKLQNMLERDLKILRGNRDVLEKRAKSVKEQRAAEQVYDEIAHVDRSISTLNGFKSAGAYADYKKWKNMEGSQIKPM